MRPSVLGETTVCRVMADALGLDAVRPNDDFFALGGHSLLASRIVARLTDEGYAVRFVHASLSDTACPQRKPHPHCGGRRRCRVDP